MRESTQMKQKLAFLLALGLGGGIVAGCSIGMMPEGSSVEEIKAIREKWPPEKQIEGIRHSPMPYPEQQKQIAAIRAKYHMPSEDTPAVQETKTGGPPQ